MYNCRVDIFHVWFLNIPGADHILAQPLKRCSASRIKSNETFELAKTRRNTLWFGVWKHTLFWGVKTYSVLGCVGERISLRCRQVTSKVPKTVKNLFVLQFCSRDGSFRHDEMKIWLCLYFQHVTRHIGTDFAKENRQKVQRSEEEYFFGEGCFDKKECFQRQRINAVHGRCSSSCVLGDIPSNFTRSVRRQIVL